MKRIDRELCGYTYGGQRVICSSWFTRLEKTMAVLVLILLIAEYLSGFALKEQDSWMMAVRTALIDGDVNINSVKTMVGHSDARTTYRSYVFDRSTDAERRSLMEAALCVGD